MAIECRVEDASPSELLYFLSHFRKTGVFKIDSENIKGEIYIKNGKIVHAINNDKVGLEALYNLTLAQQGKEFFVLGEFPPSETIAEESAQLISEAERRRIELRELMEKIPPLDTVLQRATRLNSNEPITLRKSDWKVFVLTDGEGTLKDVIETSEIGILEVYASISWLIEKGFILDPVAALRELNTTLTKVNELVKVYGEGGVGIPSWINYLKEQVDKYDPDGSKLAPFFIWNTEGLGLNQDNISSSNATVINEFMQRLGGMILEKAVNDYGKIIAKRKYDQVMKKISQREDK